MYLWCSLVVLFWWVLIGLVVMLETNASMACLEAERVALLKLKEVFNHPNGSSLSSWQPHGGDCCTWESVICDNSTKRVTHLFLNYTRPYELSNMQWSLNASYLLPFQDLQGLDLSGNYLAGLTLILSSQFLYKHSLLDNSLLLTPRIQNFGYFKFLMFICAIFFYLYLTCN